MASTDDKTSTTTRQETRSGDKPSESPQKGSAEAQKAPEQVVPQPGNSEPQEGADGRRAPGDKPGRVDEFDEKRNDAGQLAPEDGTTPDPAREEAQRWASTDPTA